MDLIHIVKEQAKLFTEDNFDAPRQGDYLLVENAMLIGL